MSNVTYEPKIYAGINPDMILERLRMDGWDPIPIRDRPGYVYPPHSHATSKVLAIVEGSMDVGVADTTYRCQAGDQIVIPGGVEHAALVGSEGCTFYWSEQVR